MSKKIDLSEAEIDFGENDEQKDEKLIKLIMACHKKEVACRMALVEFDFIKPFTDYKPEIDEKIKRHFLKKLQNRDFMKLLVYQEGDKFVMSDDYNAYYFYKEIDLKKIPCVVIGEIKNKKGVLKMGEEFYLEGPPSVDVVE
jgi:hypothetical protein